MILHFLGRRTAVPPSAAEIIHAAIVAQAREPAFYTRFAVPDTLSGRFELVVLHAVLYLNRMKREPPAARAVGQEVFDVMFRAFDASLRELGVGDVAVPKRMKAMGAAFYDGAAAYDRALQLADRAALAREVARIVYRDAPAVADGPDLMAGYMLRVAESLDSQAGEALATRGPAFPPPEGDER